VVAKSLERGEVRYEVAGMEWWCDGSGDEDGLLVVYLYICRHHTEAIQGENTLLVCLVRPFVPT
jgi:hypothetical protein